MNAALTIARTEFVTGIRRAAPWAAAAVFVGNAVLWWAGGPAISRGWAINGDIAIRHFFIGFTFLTMPFFAALLVADAMVRDWNDGVLPLIASTPITRVQHVAGKFAGAFAVLLAAEAMFPLAFVLLQPFALKGMIVLEPRFLPYVVQFAFTVAISSALVAACCFAAGSLTFEPRLVYAAVPLAYGAYAAWQIKVLRNVTAWWRVTLDPLLMNNGAASAALVNRVAVVIATIAILAIVAQRMPAIEQLERKRQSSGLTLLTLSDDVFIQPRNSTFDAARARLALEIRMLMETRGLIAIVVLTGVIFAFAADAEVAPAMLLMTFGITLFVTGETLHRERALGVEPLVITTPISNGALLLPKLAAVLILIFVLIVIAILPSPARLATSAIAVFLPNAVFLASVALLLHRAAPEKHLANVLGLAAGGAFIFLAMNGYDHWSYNVVLHRVDLAGGVLLLQRGYALALSALFVWMAMRLEQKSPAGTGGAR